ncbi:MAG TPA: hypothetical protein VGP41_14445 [Candidatus Lustribacter sp.]|nr:hypothetical protein [Candidatus Lustribacter sp.]
MLAQQTYSNTFVPDLGLGYHVTFSVVVIVHLLLAITLLGALTHQTLSLLWPFRSVVSAGGGSPAPPSIGQAYRGVRVTLYTNAIIVLYVLTAFVGALMYGPYRLSILPFFYGHGLKLFGGIFELKEHFVVIGLALLPVYWMLWKKVPLNEQVSWRAAVTTILAAFVWYSFLVGHVLNNLKGFGT